MAQSFRLSLDGPAFNSLKTDFDRLLTTTIEKMQNKSVEDATITAKLDIHLMVEGNPNGNAPDSPEEQVYIAPEFKHKVTAAMQVKQEASGTTGGKKYELIWDGKSGAFIMRKVSENPNQIEIWESGGDGEASVGEDAETVEVTEELAADVVSAAAAIVREAGIASVTLLQRKMRIGYSLAAALLDRLEADSVVGPFNGSAPREVLPWDDSAEEGGGDE